MLFSRSMKIPHANGPLASGFCKLSSKVKMARFVEKLFLNLNCLKQRICYSSRNSGCFQYWIGKKCVCS